MKLLILFFSILLFTPQQTETYYIIKVKGDIMNLKTGKNLKQGDAIVATDKLKFVDKTALALVISDVRGRFTLKAPKSQETNGYEFTAFVRNALVGKSRIQFSTRSIVSNSDIKDLKEFLGEDEFTIIGNKLDINLSKEDFANQSIIAKYNKKGNLVGKDLIADNYKMTISRDALEVKTWGEVKLYHVDFYKKTKTLNKEEKITRLDINFIVKSALYDEFKTIIGVYKKKDYSAAKMKSYLIEYFIDFYGNTHRYQLNKFIDKVIAENME